MTQYLVAIHHPDDYDPSVAEDEAMHRDIDALIGRAGYVWRYNSCSNAGPKQDWAMLSLGCLNTHFPEQVRQAARITLISPPSRNKCDRTAGWAGKPREGSTTSRVKHRGSSPCEFSTVEERLLRFTKTNALSAVNRG